MMDKEKAEKLLEDIRNLVNSTLPENDSPEERMALNEASKRKPGIITESELNEMRTLLRAQGIFMSIQKREVLEYEQKLQRHIDRMEKILEAFMLSVRRDMAQFEKRLEEYEMCKGCKFHDAKGGNT
ncbi:MAG: hypothetical protein J6A00_04435 [Bacteroides sp.]|jgi:hypothetical protein|uniref:Uncharacterized protein n=1 Tax=Phocaeicola sartorii TaxID=671267 RepID=A0A4S2FN58_9BACT|nr:hypothetical protein [Phocaeicola sartorii]MBO5506994.1 hypothetical protein [Bacteroides sp.]NUK98088.1 hypothetical protein [Phocaeicola sartorii]TGY70496.1 hypothetical protein E5339_09390 [Phocaeicola sartorii]